MIIAIDGPAGTGKSTMINEFNGQKVLNEKSASPSKKHLTLILFK